MAKKELNFGKLGLPTKAVIVKKDEQKEPAIEKAIEKIHGNNVKTSAEIPVEKQNPVILSEEKTSDRVVVVKTPPVRKTEVIELEEMMPVKKISMDLPLDVYKYLKINSFDKACTMKDYVLRLIEADMKKNKK
jgi:hypothetical protein